MGPVSEQFLHREILGALQSGRASHLEEGRGACTQQDGLWRGGKVHPGTGRACSEILGVGGKFRGKFRDKEQPSCVAWNAG